MEVDKQALIGVLEELGHEGAEKFSEKKLLKLAQKFASLGEDERPEGEETAELFDEIVAAVNNGDELELVEVVDEEEAEEEAEEEKPKKNKKKGGKAAAAEKNGKPKKKDKKKSSKKTGPKGVGVIAAIVEMLTKATKKNPISKEAMLAELVKKFPDRDAEGMKSTIGIQVPGRLSREKNLTIVKTDKGFYVSA